MKNMLAQILLMAMLSFIFTECDNSKVPEKSGNTTDPTGEQLAKSLCGSCHKLPHPSDLNKVSWEEYVLPRMGYFLGIYDEENNRESLIEKGSAEAYIQSQNIFPEQRLIDSTSWEKIKAYYISNSPVVLTISERNIDPKTDIFKAVRPAFSLIPPSVTSIQFNQAQHRLYVGDAFSQSLHILSDNLQPIGIVKTGESPVHLEENEHALLATIMGSFSPTDAASGQLLEISKTGNGVTVLLDSLQRPVHHATADFNNDGRDDFVVCEFAKWTGGLTWFKNTANGFERKYLSKQPGATKVFVRDYNQDGFDDVIALFAQGNEGIWLFENQQNETFKSIQLLQFPASFGSSFMNIQDLNNDGLDDIIYCAGDNADFSPILKPYHGVYTYLNQGNNRFEQDLFLPLNGAYSAIILDFDLDGDKDVAAISFFPDFANTPQEGFVYFENQNGSYAPSSFKEVSFGRWIVLEHGDVDNDGDQDLFLGSLAFEVPGNESLVNQWVQNGIPFVLLENLTKN